MSLLTVEGHDDHLGTGSIEKVQRQYGFVDPAPSTHHTLPAKLQLAFMATFYQSSLQGSAVGCRSAGGLRIAPTHRVALDADDEAIPMTSKPHAPHSKDPAGRSAPMTSPCFSRPPYSSLGRARCAWLPRQTDKRGEYACWYRASSQRSSLENAMIPVAQPRRREG